jgi:hypothetical protein
MSNIAKKVGADNPYNQWMKLNTQFNCGKLSKYQTDDVNKRWKAAETVEHKEALIANLRKKMLNQKSALFGFLQPTAKQGSSPPVVASAPAVPPPAPPSEPPAPPSAPTAPKQKEVNETIDSVCRAISELAAIECGLGLTDQQRQQKKSLIAQKDQLPKSLHTLEVLLFLFCFTKYKVICLTAESDKAETISRQ